MLKLADVSGVKRDLADLAHHHQQLQAEADALRAVVEALPAPAWVRDADGRIAFVNSAYARAVEAPDADAAPSLPAASFSTARPAPISTAAEPWALPSCGAPR